MLFNKHILKQFLKNIWLFAIGVIALIAVDLVSMQIPYYLGKVVDLFGETITPEVSKQITTYAGLTFGVSLGMFFGRLIWRFTILRGSHKIEAGLRHEMFLKAEKLSVSYYHHNKVGNIMSWMTSDLETIEEFFGWGTVMLIDGIFLTSFTLVSMFKVEWQITLLVLIPFVLIIIWGALCEKFMSDAWEQRQKVYDELYDFSQESFSGIRVIKAFVKTNQQFFAFTKVARKNADSNLKFARISVIFDVIIEIIIGAIIASVIGLSGYFVYYFTTGGAEAAKYIFSSKSPIELTVGDLVTYVAYVDYLIWPTIAMGSVVSMYARAHACAKRISNFLNEEITVKSPKDAIKFEKVKGEIEFKDFHFKYASAKEPTLNGITLKINAGESIGIVGKIGCGKTTITNILMRLFNYDEGKVFVDDIDLMKADIDTLRDNIAYVPQDNFLFSDLIKNNIAFSDPNLSMDEIIKAAKFAQVADDIDGFEKGYETISGERGVTLSGGQKQRISIARAFIKNAPILIFDDSVSAVDVKTEEQILKNIKKEREGKTTIVVASRISTVSHLDKILCLKDGVVEGFAPHNELIKISPTYAKMVYLQELEKEVEGGK